MYTTKQSSICVLFCLSAVLLLLLQSQSASAIRCKKDADCGNNSVCDNGTCVINIDCRINYDCVRFGIYQECQHYRCVKSSYHLCQTDEDCPSIIYRHCRNYQCRA